MPYVIFLETDIVEIYQQFSLQQNLNAPMSPYQVNASFDTLLPKSVYCYNQNQFRLTFHTLYECIG